MQLDEMLWKAKYAYRDRCDTPCFWLATNPVVPFANANCLQDPTVSTDEENVQHIIWIAVK